MDFNKARQLRTVSEDEVSALIALVRPILTGILNTLKADVVQTWGRDNVPLKLLPRLHRRGDGDCGICFEYAVHDALNRGDGPIVERVGDALRMCKISVATSPTSILFGAEKSGAVQIIETARATLTENSRLLKGGAGQPIRIGRYLDTIQDAFRDPNARAALPSTINGLWKADLILGCPAADRWVAATVKINAAQLEAAQGIRIGIVPGSRRHGDLVRAERGLIVCPIPHDFEFMQKFYEAWRIVRAFLDADANVPSNAALPRPEEREVARVLAERRDYSVREVIHVLASFAQPELLLDVPQEVATVTVEHRTFWQRLFLRETIAKSTPVLMPPESRSVLAPIPLTLH